MPRLGRVAVTGSRGALGSALLPLLGANVVGIDRRDGLEIEDAVAIRAALRGCDAVVHLAALHPLVAPPDATEETYRAANVTPFATLLDRARECGIRRVVLASSTSVWSDERVRIVDEGTPPDATSPYAASKRECERLLATSGLDGVVLRLARFARPDDPADDVRKLYRAVDVRDAASAVALALELGRAGAAYALSAPTPFDESDVALLASDPRAAILRRTQREPAWIPERVGSVVRARRAPRELGWRCRHPSSLLSA